MMRKCRKCGNEKPIEQFSKAPKCIGGYAWQCRRCIYDRNLAKIDPAILAERPRIKAAALLAEGKKKCPSCGVTKAVDQFHQGNAVRWGKHGIASQCKECASKKNQEYRRSHRDRLEEYNKKYRERADIAARRKTSKRRRNASSPRHVLQITLRHGLNRKITEVPATLDELMAKFEAQEGRCALTGIKMTWGRGKVLPTSISLDRIDHEGGYSADNVRLICSAINSFRGRMSDAAMLEMARALIAKADGESKEPKWHPYVVLSEVA